ncbi:MAG: hypothetical protein RI935_349 [Candidatus Parcubacteria bacterium]|jgi:hypothetical protein
MTLSKEHRDYSIYIAKYLGVALIAGSVVHVGTLEADAIRYVILGCIGLILMITGSIYEAREKNQAVDMKYILLVTGLSFGTGFLSGGIQHYLDNPGYAGMLLGIGLVLAYITFFIKEKYILSRKSIVVVSLIAFVIVITSVFLIDTLLLGASHTH